MGLRSAPTRWFAGLLPSFVACGGDLAMTGTASDGSTSLAPESGLSTTSGTPTTGVSEPEVLRGLYYRSTTRWAPPRCAASLSSMVSRSRPSTCSYRLPTPLQAYSHLFDAPRWFPVTARGADPSHFWLVDIKTLVPHELAIA